MWSILIAVIISVIMKFYVPFESKVFSFRFLTFRAYLLAKIREADNPGGPSKPCLDISILSIRYSFGYTYADPPALCLRLVDCVSVQVSVADRNELRLF